MVCPIHSLHTFTIVNYFWLHFTILVLFAASTISPVCSVYINLTSQLPCHTCRRTEPFSTRTLHSSDILVFPPFPSFQVMLKPYCSRGKYYVWTNLLVPMLPSSCGGLGSVTFSEYLGIKWNLLCEDNPRNPRCGEMNIN